jgi:hypothetical protein
MAAKGKWAQGIPPRNFAWIMKDRLAVSERPGGYGANHRRVRRQEEIIWIREQGFSCVLSVIPAPHNLHNYDDLGVTWRHRGFDTEEDPAPFLASFYPELRSMLEAGQKLLLHADVLGDPVCGLVTGYLVWSGLVPRGPEAVTLIEQMVKRQLGPYGRELVAVAAVLPNASTAARDALAEAAKPPEKPSPRKAPAASAPATKAPAKKAAAKKAPAKKAAAKQPAAAKKAAPKTAAAKKAPAKQAPAKKSAAKKAKSTASRASAKR